MSLSKLETVFNTEVFHINVDSVHPFSALVSYHFI